MARATDVWEDPRLDERWINGRPQIYINRDFPHDLYAAYAMELALTPDGMMTVTLAVERVSSSVDGGQGAEGTITIEGLLSIVCPSGQTNLEFPVSPGVTANVRCGVIEEPETACDDTVNDGVFSGCSMRSL